MDFDKTCALRFARELEIHDTIVLTRHERPDGDALGSVFGFRDALRAKYPGKKIISVSDDFSQKLSFLGEDDDDISEDEYGKALVIVIDCGSVSQISNKRWNQGGFVVKIDHHASGDDFAGLSFVFPEAAASAEIVSEMVLDLGFGAMTKNAAALLYAGIVTDTGGFRFSVSSGTFVTASRLVSYGFDVMDLTGRLFLRSRKEAELSGVLCGMIKMTPSGAAYLRLDRDVIKTFEMTREEAGDTVNLMNGIDGIPVWAVFIGEEDGTYHVRLRSRGANVRIIAEKFGGGGHDGASGAHLKTEDEIPAVIAELDKTAKESLDNPVSKGYNN